MTCKALTAAGETPAKMARRILATWERATPAQREQGATWYAEAHAVAHDVARAASTTVEHAAAVISHLSPRTTWARNVAGAMALATTGDAPGCIGANVERARRALDAADPIATINGPKTRAFARNILGDTDAVTVDVWAARIALDGRADAEALLGRAGAYDAVSDAYRAAARRAGVSPATMQAATWIVARNGRAA